MDDDLPTEYDVIIIGTGLVESIVAAAASRIGKKVLHIDDNSCYGHLWATLNLENIEQYFQKGKISDKKMANNVLTSEEYVSYDTIKGESSMTNVQLKWFISQEDKHKSEEEEVNIILSKESDTSENERIWTYADIKKMSQKFNIDLAPRILFSKGPMVELLIRSGVSRYTEFVSVHNILLHSNSITESVPYSKADVFSTRSVSVVEKRILMRLLQEIQHFNLTENEFTNKETFYDFLKRFKIPDNIEKYILHSIARVSNETSCTDGIKAAQYFLNSLGVYSNSPFLWPLYGSSELVQAFCRLCAVYGGIYCLNRNAEQILVKENNCVGILSDGKVLNASYVLLSSNQVPSEFFLSTESMETISRAILITNKTLYPEGKKGASILQYPLDDPSLPPITLIELDNSTLASPKGLCLVHLIRKGTDNYSNFDQLIQELFAPCEELQQSEANVKDKPNILFKLYFTLSQIKSEYSDVKPQNFYVCTGPIQFELDFFSALIEAENIFRQMYPNEEFLPTPVETAVTDE